MDNTKIEWTDATWNPIRGCSRVSEGCRFCYAETVAARFCKPGLAYDGLIAKGGQWNGQIKVVDSMMDQPLRWRRPRRIFVNSMSDLFHENVPNDVIDRIFAVMALAPEHTFQVLTKRAARMRQYLSAPAAELRRRWAVALPHGWVTDMNCDAVQYGDEWPLPNAWMGVSVENQEAADERIPLLLGTPAAVRWLSCEPLLGAIDLSIAACWPCPNVGDAMMDPETGAYECCRACDHTGTSSEWGIDWVVVGGESGPHARPMHPHWATSLRDQCVSAGVPFFFKQWGEWLPPQQTPAIALPLMTKAECDRREFVWVDGMPIMRTGKKAAGRLLDGQLWDQFPEVRA